MGEYRPFSLFSDEDPVEPIVDTRTAGTLEERAAAFDAQNPHVYRRLAKLARHTKFERGAKAWSINGAFEVLRWSAMGTTGDVYKLNNSYRAWYARELMTREPDLAGFFETRASPHDADYYAKGGR